MVLGTILGLKEYNDQGKLVRFETSDGYWCTKEYNDQGEVVRYENSTGYKCNL
jgi:hypothetical protein